MRVAASLGVGLGLALGCSGAAEMQESAQHAPLGKAKDGAYGGEAGGMPVEMEAAKLQSIGYVNGIDEEGDFDADDRSVTDGLVATEPEAPPPPPKGGGEAQAVRQWFPEAFLWRPRVETDATGSAQLDVRVPDALTTWRVLALAHDRAGHQAGAVHRFEGTLPAYVDPVVPGWMHQGDEILLPVQVVNQEGAPLTGALSVSVSDAVQGEYAGEVAVGPYGSAVRVVSLSAEGTGAASLSASLPGVDAVRRGWLVQPTGRPVQAQRGGSLSGSRELTMAWPENATGSELTVQVHPGPLAVLTAELERLGGGGPGAYGRGVAQHLETLAAATGATVDPGALRTHRIRSWQRLVREARSPTAPEAADLLLGLAGASGDPLLDTLRERLVRQVVAGQRGDGSWARADRDTLQRVLVQTAVAGRSLPPSETGARLRAGGALERNLPSIEDPYTAAVVLASGLAEADETLLSLVRDGLVESAGQKTVSVPEGVASPWASRPSRTEMLAWTALALHDSDPELSGDLVSELMSSWSAEWGFGAGPADGVALEAVVLALPTVDAPIQLSLSVDGAVVSTATVDPAQPRVPAVLSATPPPGASQQWTLSAEPVGAGLAFVASQRSWVPWRGDEGIAGVDVEVSHGPLRAGQEGELTIVISAPSGARVQVVQGLPPGVEVDEWALSAVGGLERFEIHPDRIVLHTEPFGAGEVLEVPVQVTPTYAGRMRSRPQAIAVAGQRVEREPMLWTVSSR